MASGFGTFTSSTYFTSGSGRGYLRAWVSQTVDSTNRTVKITVDAYLSYYRNSGGNWNPGTSSLFYNHSSGNYIKATVDGSTNTSGQNLGLKGNNKTLNQGSYYTTRDGNVAANTVAHQSKSATFNYNSSGSAITKSWSASIKYGSTTMSVSGSVTTDSIAPAYTAPTGLDVSLDSFTDTSATLSASVSSYGNPASATGRYIEAAILNQNSYGASYRFATARNTTSSSITVNNSSSANPSSFSIEGNHQYWYGAYANNTQKHVSLVKGNFVTLPAYITSVGSVDNGHGSVSFTISHASEGSAYTVQNQYSLNQTTWVNMTGSTVNLTLDDTTTVYFRRSSTAGVTPVVSKTVTPFFNRFIYLSVGGESKKAKKIYTSVNGVSKKVKKVYVSVNGVSKLVYKSS